MANEEVRCKYGEVYHVEEKKINKLTEWLKEQQEEQPLEMDAQTAQSLLEVWVALSKRRCALVTEVDLSEVAQILDKKTMEEAIRDINLGFHD